MGGADSREGQERQARPASVGRALPFIFVRTFEDEVRRAVGPADFEHLVSLAAKALVGGEKGAELFDEGLPKFFDVPDLREQPALDQLRDDAVVAARLLAGLVLLGLEDA